MHSSEPDRRTIAEAGEGNEFYEDAPCGFLSLRVDGTIVSANRTFLRSVGYPAATLLGKMRLQDLLAPASRILHDTQWAPLLRLRTEVLEVPAELVRADGSRLPVLLNANVKQASHDGPITTLVSVFDASDRRRYERELVAARDVERIARVRIERLHAVSTALAAALTPQDVAATLLDELVAALDVTQGRVWGSPVDPSSEPLARCEPKHADPADLAVSWLQLPLSFGDATVGTLEIAFPADRAVSEEEREFMNACTAQSAQALQRARLFEEVAERSAQQSNLAALGSRALTAVDEQSLLSDATQVVRETMRASVVRIVETSASPAGEVSGFPRGSLISEIGKVSRKFGEIGVHPIEGRSFTDGDRSFLDGVASVVSSAIERRRGEETIRYQAHHDPLTGLPNRLQLEQRLAHEIARSQRTSARIVLCLLDLDDFKVVNDSLGHTVGDQLLRAVAERLNSSLRNIDLVGRLGGDEFAVACFDVTTGFDQVLAERIERAFDQPFQLGSRTHTMRVSVGLVNGGANSVADDLLRDADIAMYDAKARGGGQHVRFDPAMLELGRHRMQVESELRQALADGDLRVHYQPIVTASTRHIASLEALVRWHHPTRGLVPPDEFIPVAERSGLIAQLGQFVLTESCAQLVRWRAAGVVDRDVTIAVNVSGHQLSQRTFPTDVAHALDQAGLADTPHLLELEITETVLMESDAPTVVLGELARIGVGLHLDDFGTGASSLARLKRFPVNTIKIDRSFISGIAVSDSEDDAIVAAIVAMARALGLAVVAEGVETTHQRNRLIELGCDLLQGYLFSPPRPAAEIVHLLTHEHTIATRT